MQNRKAITEENKSNDKIRVGIIGLGGWAKYGHIPVLQALRDNYEIVAVTSRKKETAEQYAADFGITHAFDNEQELINHPDVDMVLITAPAPEHHRLVKAVIQAGKDVYSEWPLTTKTTDSEELLTLAEAKGVRHLVGLQRRLGPAARYFSDLIKQGYIGKVRAAHMTVSVDAFPDTMPYLSTLRTLGLNCFRPLAFQKNLLRLWKPSFPFLLLQKLVNKYLTKIPIRSWLLVL
jgi:predicted dehydrogenase